jgi:hypothetical protein
VHFENKNVLSTLRKCSTLLPTTLALYIVVNPKVVGLAPGKMEFA